MTPSGKLKGLAASRAGGAKGAKFEFENRNIQLNLVASGERGA